VVVTCRTQEYEQLLAAYATGLGLVQAVEMLPLTSEQLDSAFVELAKRDKDWETFLSQRDLTAYKRVRQLMSNPLFLNLAVVGHLSPEQLLDATTTEQDLRDLVLESYLDSTLADQRPYEPQDARSYLSWIARFLNGGEVSPFGLKTSDYTVFDLADLTPPVPPRGYRLFEGLVLGLGFGLGLSWSWVGVSTRELVEPPVRGLVLGLGLALPTGWPVKRSAVSSRLTLASWPSTSQQLLGFLRRAGRGLVLGLSLGLLLGLLFGLVAVLGSALEYLLGRNLEPGVWLVVGLLHEPIYALIPGLGLALVLGLGYGLLETRSVLITSRTPKEARSSSLIAALTWLVSGLVGGLVGGLGHWLLWRLGVWLEGGILFYGLIIGPGFGLDLALRNGGWFVLLQKVAHRRLARAGNLPSPPYDFLEWGIEKQIFRRVGGGVRFRHSLIQQHLAGASEGVS
jgi:hypothetical protein